MAQQRKRNGYWSWREKQPDQPLLPPPNTEFYHPAKHYEIGQLAHQADKHLEHALEATTGDGFYDKIAMSDRAILEIADCTMREFCERLGVRPYPEQWPPEIQQVWATYSTAAATEVTHRQGQIRPMPWDDQIETLKAIASKHGKHARKTTGW
jgi:hypothetical protein